MFSDQYNKVSPRCHSYTVSLWILNSEIIVQNLLTHIASSHSGACEDRNLRTSRGSNKIVKAVRVQPSVRPLWARLTVVRLSGDGALSGRVAVLVAPLPVDATDDPRPWDNVLHHLGTEQAALATQVGLRLLHSLTCRQRGSRFTTNTQQMFNRPQLKMRKRKERCGSSDDKRRSDGALTELVLADGGDGAVQLESRQRQVVSLTAGVLPHLFDPDVSPALLLLFGRVQRPRGCRPEAQGRKSS